MGDVLTITIGAGGIGGSGDGASGTLGIATTVINAAGTVAAGAVTVTFLGGIPGSGPGGGSGGSRSSGPTDLNCMFTQGGNENYVANGSAGNHMAGMHLLSMVGLTPQLVEYPVGGPFKPMAQVVVAAERDTRMAQVVATAVMAGTAELAWSIRGDLTGQAAHLEFQSQIIPALAAGEEEG